MSMSYNDMIPYRESFDQSAAVLGWTLVKVEETHERDYDRSWTENVWMRDGVRLFSESDLERGMVEEIIRIAGLLRDK